ncbi:MAG: superinfection immunity protein [Wenzhouxiangella sp.]|nr:MAG: superinfection immunity protein [Wenzhouxiangella sp.]
MLTANEIFYLVILMIPFILIPTAIGWYRQHPRLGALAALNILGLVFFGVGWVLALVWAVTEPARASEQQRG